MKRSVSIGIASFWQLIACPVDVSYASTLLSTCQSYFPSKSLHENRQEPSLTVEAKRRRKTPTTRSLMEMLHFAFERLGTNRDKMQPKVCIACHVAEPGSPAHVGCINGELAAHALQGADQW